MDGIVKKEETQAYIRGISDVLSLLMYMFVKHRDEMTIDKWNEVPLILGISSETAVMMATESDDSTHFCANDFVDVIEAMLFSEDDERLVNQCFGNNGDLDG